MKTNHTKGDWKANLWGKNYASGISCLGKNEDGFEEFRGDAVNETKIEIVSKIEPSEHDVQGDFQGANIASIVMFSDESKANAKLIVAAPKLLEDVIAYHGRINEWIEMLKNGSQNQEVIEQLNHFKFHSEDLIREVI